MDKDIKNKTIDRLQDDDIDDINDSDDETIDSNELDDSDDSDDYSFFRPSAEEVREESEIADILSDIDAQCRKLLNKKD